VPAAVSITSVPSSSTQSREAPSQRNDDLGQVGEGRELEVVLEAARGPGVEAQVDARVERRVADRSESARARAPARRVVADEEMVQPRARLLAADLGPAPAGLEAEPHERVLPLAREVEHERLGLRARGHRAHARDEARRRVPLAEVLDEGRGGLGARLGLGARRPRPEQQRTGRGGDQSDH
jgi:hypothetical protein